MRACVRVCACEFLCLCVCVIVSIQIEMSNFGECYTLELIFSSFVFLSGG